MNFVKLVLLFLLAALTGCTSGATPWSGKEEISLIGGESAELLYFEGRLPADCIAPESVRRSVTWSDFFAPLAGLEGGFTRKCKILQRTNVAEIAAVAASTERDAALSARDAATAQAAAASTAAWRAGQAAKKAVTAAARDQKVSEDRLRAIEAAQKRLEQKFPLEVEIQPQVILPSNDLQQRCELRCEDRSSQGNN